MTDRLHGFVVDDIDCVHYVSKIQKFSSRRRRGLLFPSMLKDKLDVPPHVGDLAGHGRGSIAKYLSMVRNIPYLACILSPENGCNT